MGKDFLERLEPTANDEVLEEMMYKLSNEGPEKFTTNEFLVVLAVKILEMEERQKRILVNQNAIMQTLSIESSQQHKM